MLAALGAGLWWFLDRKDGPGKAPERPNRSLLVELPAIQRPLMGTSASIRVHAPDEETGRQAVEAAFARGEEINAICTDYDPESELMRLSRAPINKPVKISPTLTAVLAHALATAELTEGAFDPTLGPLTRLWRQTRQDRALPAGDQLAAARERVGWEHVDLDIGKQQVVLRKEGMQLDLGGIAKGFAADEMMEVLKQHGIGVAFIAIAGDLRLGMPPPGKRAWRVGLKTLGPELTQYIEVANCAVSTSGDLYQFVEIEGVRYSHIIDPSTGLGLTERTAATVVAPTAVQTDPLATFCCINPEEALRVFEAGEISCRIVSLQAGRPFSRTTPQFPPVQAL